jgi:hypothetical protein
MVFIYSGKGSYLYLDLLSKSSLPFVSWQIHWPVNHHDLAEAVKHLNTRAVHCTTEALCFNRPSRKELQTEAHHRMQEKLRKGINGVT